MSRFHSFACGGPGVPAPLWFVVIVAKFSPLPSVPFLCWSKQCCQFQVYHKMIQLFIYLYLFFFKVFSHLGYYRILKQSSLYYTVGPCWLSVPQHHLLQRLFSLNGLGTFIENQLTINRRVYFCTFSFFVCLYVCPYAITTLPWLLLLYSKFWNFDVYILLCSFFRLVIWGLLLFHQYFRISLSASTSWDSTGITPKYFSKYTWYFFF